MLLLLKAEMEEIEARAAAIKQEKADCQARIDSAICETIKQARAIQGKEFGTVTALINGVTVKHSITPKVTWDQTKLFDLFDRISKAGDTPGDYMKITFAVPESNYKKFAPEIRQHFDAARTVEPGTVKVELTFKE